MSEHGALWDRAWQSLEPALIDFGRDLSRHDPSIRFTEGRWTPTEIRPFGAWANAVKMVGESESVLSVSVTFRIADRSLQMDADVDYETPGGDDELARIAHHVLDIHGRGNTELNQQVDLFIEQTKSILSSVVQDAIDALQGRASRPSEAV